MSAEKIDHLAAAEPAHGNHTNSKYCPALSDAKAADQDPRRDSRLGGEIDVSRGPATTGGQLPTPAVDSTAAQDQFLLNWVRSEAEASPRKQLKARYPRVNSIGALTMMMREACRLFEGSVGSQLLVVDAYTNEIVRSFDRPLEIMRRGTKWLERIAVSSITETMDMEPEDDENAYQNRLDVILHVYCMPVGRYKKRAGNLVKAYGQHILTYQRWDKDLEDIEAPFPDHDLTLWPEASYLFNNALGYQGFDGMNWRSDWYHPDGTPKPSS